MEQSPGAEVLDGKKQSAIDWGIRWANADPEHRILWATTAELNGPEGPVYEKKKGARQFGLAYRGD